MLERLFEALMGNDEYFNLDSLLYTIPNESYNHSISDYVTCTNIDFSSIVTTSWTV